MTNDFNICNNDWDPLYLHHTTHTDDLTTIVDTFNLDLLLPVNPDSTRFADNSTNNNSVHDLMFINSLNIGFNNHYILQDKRLLFDYTLLYVAIQIDISNIDKVKRNIKVGNKKEMKFNTFIASRVFSLNSEALTLHNDIETLTNNIAQIFDKVWDKFSKEIKITKYSKI